MIFELQVPVGAPVTIPISAAPLFGQIQMESLHVLGALVIAVFVIASSMIGRQILHASLPARFDDQVEAGGRNLDQAA